MSIELPARVPEACLERILAARLPSIHLKPRIAEVPLSKFASKFGGASYWPKHMDYPVDQKQRRMMLLAQLNFHELPHIEGYPQEGILQFFITMDDDLYGLNFADPRQQSNFRVVYHPILLLEEDGLADIRPEVTEESFVPLTREHALTATRVFDAVSMADYRFDQVVAGSGWPTDLTGDEVHQLCETLRGDGSKVGGYASFTQEDPRAYPLRGGSKPAERESEWLLLFQMDSHGRDIMWGDVGIANWFIREPDLERLDFSNVWYNWDCS